MGEVTGRIILMMLVVMIIDKIHGEPGAAGVQRILRLCLLHRVLFSLLSKLIECIVSVGMLMAVVGILVRRLRK